MRVWRRRGSPPVATARRPDSMPQRDGSPRSSHVRTQTWVGIALILGAAIVLQRFSRVEAEFGVFGGLGLALGFIMQRSQLAGCALRTGGGLLTHTFLLNVGLFGGALISALLANEFKPRFSRNKLRYVQSLAGGLSMGYGAGLAMGCTIGAFFSAIPSLALNGWVFALALAGGAFLGTHLLRFLP